MAEREPAKWVTFVELQEPGWPFPKEIPDEATIPRADITVETIRRPLTADEAGEYKVHIRSPIRCGDKLYIYTDGKFRETDGQEVPEAGDHRGSAEELRPGGGPQGPAR